MGVYNDDGGLQGRRHTPLIIRSLYHFDGNVKDSSYWNYATSFAWKKGASITYLESKAFYNGTWRSGTGATVRYARRLGREITVVAPNGHGPYSSFSGSSFPYGNTKSPIRIWLLSLYIRPAPYKCKLFPCFPQFPCAYCTISPPLLLASLAV